MKKYLALLGFASLLFLGLDGIAYALKFTPPPGQGYSWNISRQFPNDVRSQVVSGSAGSSNVVYDWLATRGSYDPSTTLFENFTDHICPQFQGGGVLMTNRTSSLGAPFNLVQYGKGWGSCPTLPNQ